jgi:hypothetical protein
MMGGKLVGDVCLGMLPKTRKWNTVINLIASGANVERIAAASADAAKYALDRASHDPGVAHAFWLLTQILQAARRVGFSERLAKLGVHVSSAPTLLEIVTGFTIAVDRRVRESGKRTDLGEMAQFSAAETLSSLAGREMPSLFGPTAIDVQLALAELGSSDRLSSVVARDFFSRLTSRSLRYFLSRELSKHVGPNKRFAVLSEHSKFISALDIHCRKASRNVKEFSGIEDFAGRLHSPAGRLHSPEWTKWSTEAEAGQFAYVAFQKVRAELRKRQGANA